MKCLVSKTSLTSYRDNKYFLAGKRAKIEGHLSQPEHAVHQIPKTSELFKQHKMREKREAKQGTYTNFVLSVSAGNIDCFILEELAARMAGLSHKPAAHRNPRYLSELKRKLYMRFNYNLAKAGGCSNVITSPGSLSVAASSPEGSRCISPDP